MKAAIYARVSTEEQADNGTGLIEQLEACRAYIAAHSWEPAGEYTDEGVSGTLSSRPGLDLMAAACARGEAEVVVIHRLNRLARKASIALNLCEQVESHGAGIVSVKEQMDTTTSNGKLMRTMLAGFAEFDRDSIIEQMTAGQRQRVRNGKWPGGPAPFGYRIVQADGGSYLEPDEIEAETIHTAVACIADRGLSTWETAYELDSLGMRPRSADRWSANNLRRLMLDKRYTGTWTYRTKKHGEIEMDLPPLITPAEWDRLQARLAAKSHTKRPSKPYLLSRGLLRAPCGGTFSGWSRHERNYRQYRCGNSVFNNVERCECKRLWVDEVDALVWDHVSALLWDPERVVPLAEDFLGMNRPDEPDAPQRLAEVRHDIDVAEQAIGRASATLLKAGAGAGAIREANVALEEELSQLRALEGHLVERVDQTAGAVARAESIADLAKLARSRLAVLSDLERREVLELLQVRVDVVGWNECPRCDGRGKIKGGRGGLACPRCRSTRFLPHLTLRGVVFTADLFESDVWQHADGVPRRSTWCRP